MVNEMKMHMAWPEACFQAETADQCAKEIENWVSKSVSVFKLTLRDAVERACSDEMTPESHREFADLGPLNLFAIVSGMQFNLSSNLSSGPLKLMELASLPFFYFSTPKFIWRHKSIDTYLQRPRQLEIDLDVLFARSLFFAAP
jgi:hypothetical protein